jgi:hypothetical protein
MTKPAPLFRQISTPIDVEDSALDQLADQLSMPKMVRSVAPPSPPPETIQAAPLPAPPPPAAEVIPTTIADSPAASAVRSPEERLTCFLPSYLSDAIRREGVNRRVSARHLVMLGLQAIGFEIKPEDLVPDGRRTQNKPR